MKRKLHAFLVCLVIAVAVSHVSVAQHTLMYYWNFNTYSPAYSSATPGVSVYASIPADYVDPALDSTKVRFVDRTVPGTSAAYASYCDITTGDTTNARMGAAAGSCFRARNPNDSMELLIYMPTTHFSNIWIKYACELSSYSSGDSINVFSYSNDSGTNWITSGAGLNEWVDSGSVAFKLVSVNMTGPYTYNNRKLVFRIQLVGRNNGTSGNDRFDNVTVEGDSIVSTLNVNALQAAVPVYNLFPNPAQKTINVVSSLEGTKTVIVTNAIGQEILKSEENGGQFALNIADLSAGVYTLTVRENINGSVTNLKFEKN